MVIRLKVYMADFFYLLDRIFLLFSCENLKKKIAIDFSSPRLRQSKM